MKTILFVCTGNSCRSIMAEGLFNKMLPGSNQDYRACSAGTYAVDGYPPMEETVRAMKQVGVDVSGCRSRRLTSEMVHEAKGIYVMEISHKKAILNSWPQADDKLFLMTEFSSDPKKKKEDINIPDPIHMPAGFYQDVRETIQDCVKNILKNFGVA